MKRILVLFAASAVLALLLSSAALAEQHGGGMTASPTATATATATVSPTATATASPTATATALPRSGGPPLVVPVTLVASLTLMASGVVALVLLRRRVS
jgi:hypothetical protein